MKKEKNKEINQQNLINYIFFQFIDNIRSIIDTSKIYTICSIGFTIVQYDKYVYTYYVYIYIYICIVANTYVGTWSSIIPASIGHFIDPPLLANNR